MKEQPEIQASEPEQPERWLSKKSLADYYDFSTRWVEDQVRRGMPHRRIGNQARFRISQTDSWLDAQAIEAVEV